MHTLDWIYVPTLWSDHVEAGDLTDELDDALADLLAEIDKLQHMNRRADETDS